MRAGARHELAYDRSPPADGGALNHATVPRRHPTARPFETTTEPARRGRKNVATGRPPPAATANDIRPVGVRALARSLPCASNADNQEEETAAGLMFAVMSLRGLGVGPAAAGARAPDKSPSGQI